MRGPKHNAAYACLLAIAGLVAISTGLAKAQQGSAGRYLAPVLFTYQGDPTANPFDQPVYIHEQIRNATGTRLGDRGFNNVGAIHLYAVTRATWDQLRLPTQSRCEVQAISRKVPVVTHAYFLTREGEQIRGGFGQACFMAAIYQHYGVAELPPIERLARDRDFMAIRGKWYARLYEAAEPIRRSTSPK